MAFPGKMVTSLAYPKWTVAHTVAIETLLEFAQGD